MIVVTGASGKLGRAIVEHLIDRGAGEVGVSVRDPAKAADLQALGVRVRRGDFEDVSSLAHAFEGAHQVLMVSSNARAAGRDALAQHQNAIEAAREAGVRRIVYTSHRGASAASAFPPMWDHAATEDMLGGSGLAWTALRNGFYADTGVMLMGDISRTGLIEGPADGKVSWTTHADLAEGAAVVLMEEGCFDGPTPPLTGAEALNLADVAETASALLGRPVERRMLSDADLTGRMAARGAPPQAAEITLGLYRASRAGEFERVDPTLQTLLGRPPVRFRDVIAARLEAER